MQAGRRKGDRAIGRFLADTVDAVPLVSREDLEVLFNENVQVSLMSSIVTDILTCLLPARGMPEHDVSRLLCPASGCVRAGCLAGDVSCQPGTGTRFLGR